MIASVASMAHANARIELRLIFATSLQLNRREVLVVAGSLALNPAAQLLAAHSCGRPVAVTLRASRVVVYNGRHENV
jgi:hypothetical protein